MKSHFYQKYNILYMLKIWECHYNLDLRSYGQLFSFFLGTLLMRWNVLNNVLILCLSLLLYLKSLCYPLSSSEILLSLCPPEISISRSLLFLSIVLSLSFYLHLFWFLSTLSSSIPLSPCPSSIFSQSPYLQSISFSLSLFLFLFMSFAFSLSPLRSISLSLFISFGISLSLYLQFFINFSVENQFCSIRNPRNYISIYLYFLSINLNKSIYLNIYPSKYLSI